MIFKDAQEWKSINFFILDKEILINISLFFLTISLLAILGLWNFLLFHTVAEIFNSIVVFCIFIIAINTYRVNKNAFFMFIGIGSFFVGIIDLLHALAYPGIGIFAEASINLATQLPIISGLIWSITLLISNVFVSKPSRKLPLVSIYILFSFFTILSIGLILYFKVFPDCYIDGQGLTKFKLISEYIIILIYIIASTLFYNNRRKLDKTLLLYVSTSLLLGPISRFSLTLLSNDISDLSNIIAHIIKVACFLCIYKGIVQVGLQRPFDILTNKLSEVDANLKNEYTKRKDMEDILFRNDKCYELLIEKNKDAIFVHSEGRLVFVNQGAAKLSNISNSKSLIGLPVDNIIPTHYKPILSKIFNDMNVDREELSTLEFSITNPRMETIDIEADYVHFVYKGKPAILSIVRDVSSNKKIETLKKDIELSKEFNRTQAEFFANISHELKTPLTVLLGAIHLLSVPTDNIEKKLEKYLKTMRQNCFRLLRLVNNLIDLSKVETGYINLDLRNYDIINIVEEITLSVADYVENKDIELIFDTDTEEKIMAFDADKIERIILNLLSNSIKFSNPGDKISVTISDMNEMLQISVKDTGVGIPEDKLELIFDRFAQVDKTLSRNHEGSGIGLSLVKSLVSLHGGTITVKSTFGQGSEFIIKLPVKMVEQEKIIEIPPYQSNIERINIEFSDIYS